MDAWGVVLFAVGYLAGWLHRLSAGRSEHRALQAHNKDLADQVTSTAWAHEEREEYLDKRLAALREKFSVSPPSGTGLVSDLMFTDCEACDKQYFYGGFVGRREWTQCPHCHHVQPKAQPRAQ